MKKTIKKAFVARPSEWYKLTEGRKATMLEYLDLFNELQSIGYRLELI